MIDSRVLQLSSQDPSSPAEGSLPTETNVGGEGVMSPLGRHPLSWCKVSPYGRFDLLDTVCPSTKTLIRIIRLHGQYVTEKMSSYN